MRYTIYIIVFLCLVDCCLLYLYCEVSSQAQRYKIEKENLQESANEEFHKYNESLNLELNLKTILNDDCINEVLMMNGFNDECLLVILSRKTCWSCVENELMEIIALNTPVVFICPENLKNGLNLLSKGKAKILDMESILSLDKLEIFQLTYVKIKEAKCSMVYAPLFGTDLNFIKRLLE